MSLKNNYQKFRKHLKNGGLLYAIWRGIKYFIFLLRKERDRFKQLPKRQNNIISKEKIKIVCSDCGINIFWDGLEVIKGAGLNVAINTLGLWTDSVKADWQVLDKGEDYLKVKIIFRDLPLSQTWILKIRSNQEIDWQISLEIEEWLHIDEFRIVCLAKPNYKSWINNCQEGCFPRMDNYWHDLCLDEQPTSLVGLRFPLENSSLPSFILKVEDKSFLPLIQNSPVDNNTHIIGFRYIDSEEKKEYSVGQYHFFSGKVCLFEDDSLLDAMIENLRQYSLEKLIKEEAKDRKLKRKLKILLVNLPWQRNKKWGVRAGSRWPHIKDKSEDNYLPFPFFLAYAASLLQKHDIDASIIDAIAEQIPEDRFIQRILAMNFDYLVTETSVPSFYDDMNMLKRISQADIPIILCGPNTEVYRQEFLRQYPFVNFVLCGEYEYTLLELIRSLQENKTLSEVRGLIYRDGDEIIKNPPRLPLDVNLLPWPHRETLPMEKYWDLPGNIPYPSVQMLASRGCPFGCNFCLWPAVIYQNNHYRARNVEDVINEMEYLVIKNGFKSVYFDDDTFNIGKERMLKFCQALEKRNLQHTPWAIMARADLMDEEILQAMKSAGLGAVKYGVESYSQPLIKSCRKDLDLDKATRIIKLTKDLDIKVHLTFAFGVDGETKETLKRTIDHALSLDPDSVQFSILTPFPGTSLFEELESQGRILTHDWSKYDGHCNCVFKPDNLSPQDLIEAKNIAYRLWGEHLRRKRGFRGDIKRFRDYLQEYGLSYTMQKTFDYLGFICFGKNKYLNGRAR